MLGHPDVKQIATYLNAERVGRYESMKRFGTAPLWQSVAKETLKKQPRISREPVEAAASCQLNGLAGWCACPDSNWGPPA